MKNSLIALLFLALASALASSCYVARYIPDGEHVLHDVKLIVHMADSSDVPPVVHDALRHANDYYLQKPNTKLLGIKAIPFSKWMYGIAQPSDSTIWGRYWRRMGSAPVIYSERAARRTISQLEGLLQSKGCFGSSVSNDTLDISRHNITIAYRVSASQRYSVDEVNYLTDDRTVKRLLEQWHADSPLQPGSPYDQELIAAERARLVNNLREAGYYRASPQLITFRIDTTYARGLLSIDVIVDSRNLQVYHINNIFVYPNSTAGLRDGEMQYDTLIHTYPSLSHRIDYQFVYASPMTIKPQTISRALMLFPGMTYRPRYITNSYNSLLALRNFKYINIEFTESPATTDSLPLVDAHVRLINATQQRLSLSLELTNASPLGSQDSTSNFLLGGNLGIETALEYQHKNIFGGAELLKAKGSLLVELPKINFSSGNDNFRNIFSTFEAGLDLSLDMPVFLLPFASRFTRAGMRPHTLVSLGGSYQYRYYYERILANTSFGYTWSHNRRSSHQLLPVEMTFVRMLGMDETFANRLSAYGDLRLKYQYSSHFILGARYDYTFSNQQYGLRSNFSVLHLTAESAGNLLSAVGNLYDAGTDNNGILQFFGVPFAQYVRLGAEWTRYHYLFDRSSIVTRLLIGVGLPYGNSLSMPYEKSFFGGGPTTMRAWQLRHLGPGSYQGSEDMLERVGDLQLVLNLEGRFPIAGIFEGALFADMGNVWLIHASEQYADGELKWTSLPSEIAVGIGLGLRVNVSIATLRVDFALPLYDPGFAATQRWRPRHWSLGDIVTNFGINYPF